MGEYFNYYMNNNYILFESISIKSWIWRFVKMQPHTSPLWSHKADILDSWHISYADCHDERVRYVHEALQEQNAKFWLCTNKVSHLPMTDLITLTFLTLYNREMTWSIRLIGFSSCFMIYCCELRHMIWNAVKNTCFQPDDQLVFHMLAGFKWCFVVVLRSNWALDCLLSHIQQST